MAKRWFAMLLALALALSLAGSAEGEDSLWGRAVEAEIVPLPDEALDGRLEDPRVAGISGDGGTLLVIGYGGAPYLWDLEAKTRRDIFAGDEATDALFQSLYEAMLARLPDETREDLLKKCEDAPGDRRLAALMDDPVMGMRTSVRGTSGDHMLLANYNVGLVGLVDCRTGALVCPEEGEVVPPVVDGKAVVWNPQGVSLWSFESGGSEAVELGLPGWSVACARLLPDGSVCAVLEDRREPDREKGQMEALAVVRPDGSQMQYPLGRRMLGRCPDTLLCNEDGSRVVAYCAEAIRQELPCLVDLAAEKVSLLAMVDGGLTTLRLGDCLDENAVVQIKAEASDAILLPIAEMADGTLLSLNVSEGGLLLADPDSLELWTLLDDAGMEEIGGSMVFLTAMPPLSGDGRGALALPRLGGYLKLEPTD